MATTCKAAYATQLRQLLSKCMTLCSLCSAEASDFDSMWPLFVDAHHIEGCESMLESYFTQVKLHLQPSAECQPILGIEHDAVQLLASLLLEAPFPQILHTCGRSAAKLMCSLYLSQCCRATCMDVLQQTLAAVSARSTWPACCSSRQCPLQTCRLPFCSCLCLSSVLLTCSAACNLVCPVSS